MTDPIYTEMDRDEVIAAYGTSYPPLHGDPRLTVPAAEEGGVGSGTVAVWPVEGQPGIAWYVVDSAIYQQAAGTPDEALAALIPGSVLGVWEDPAGPEPDSPPHPGGPTTYRTH